MNEHRERRPPNTLQSRHGGIAFASLSLAESLMSFKTFIWYCALCGGWAALFTWAFAQFGGLQSTWIQENAYIQTGMIAGLLGFLLAGVIGFLDGLLNSVGFARILRVFVCVIVGFLGSVLAGLVGQAISGIFKAVAGVPLRFPGWMLVGIVIGGSIGVFDLLRAGMTGKGFGQATRKTINGMIGGAIGGFLGGVLNDAITIVDLRETLPWSSLATGLVVLGLFIGLLIGTAQVLLKEAWVRVESGFKAGREMILSKPETVVGRAEGCDIALFGDTGVEKQHARIVLQKDRYVLLDAQTPGGTYINGQRISGPTPLSSGDAIQVGKSVLRFEERSKRR
jgi:MFS family permease